MAAVEAGLLSRQEACSRYSLTIEEFLSWQLRLAQHGLVGLQTRKIKQHRLKLRSPPATGWSGDPLQLHINSRTHNADGSLALSKSELGERLLELAHVADGGAPKTARRFYYLALLHGYIRPDMALATPLPRRAPTPTSA